MVVVWHSISKGWRFFSQHMALVAGEGTHVLFSMIGGPKTLHLRFYILIYFSVHVLNDACISNVLGHQGDGNDRVWNLRLYGDFHDWELEAVFSFLDLI